MSLRPLTPRQRELNAEAEQRVKRRDRGAAAYQLRKLLAENGQDLSRFVRDHGDSELDAARVLGLRPETCEVPALDCVWCAGLSWRRHWAGCKGCGGSYEAEKVEAPEPRGYSSIAAFAFEW